MQQSRSMTSETTDYNFATSPWTARRNGSNVTSVVSSGQLQLTVMHGGLLSVQSANFNRTVGQ